jgi:hypothetical protein
MRGLCHPAPSLLLLGSYTNDDIESYIAAVLSMNNILRALLCRISTIYVLSTSANCSMTQPQRLHIQGMSKKFFSVISEPTVCMTLRRFLSLFHFERHFYRARCISSLPPLHAYAFLCTFGSGASDVPNPRFWSKSLPACCL